MAKKRNVKKTPVEETSKDIDFLSKLQGTLFYPGKFFSNLKEKDIKTSLIFFIFVSAIFIILDFIIRFNNYRTAYDISAGLIIPFLFLYLILLILFAIIVLYIESLFLYVFIILFRVKLKFNDTLRFKAYTSAPIIFAWIHPIFGVLLAFIWGIVIEIIGLSRYGRVSTGKSALIILLPIVIVLFLLFLIIVFALALILSSPVGFLIKDFF